MFTPTLTIPPAEALPAGVTVRLRDDGSAVVTAPSAHAADVAAYRIACATVVAGTAEDVDASPGKGATVYVTPVIW